MEKLIGFNLIMMVIWFILSMFICNKTDNWENLHSNWEILSLLTAIGSTGIYLVII